MDKIAKHATLPSNVWATIVVIEFLSTKLKSLEDDWTLLVKKAKKWVLSKVDAAGFAAAATEAQAVF